MDRISVGCRKERLRKKERKGKQSTDRSDVTLAQHIILKSLTRTGYAHRETTSGIDKRMEFSPCNDT